MRIFDFLELRNQLSEEGSELPRGKIKSIIDAILVACGYYDGLFAVDQYNKRQKISGPSKEYTEWWKKSDKRRLIEEVLVTTEAIGLIKFSREECKGQYRSRYYKIVDDRSDFEILQELMPNASEQEVVMMLKVMNTDKIHEAARIYKEFKSNTVTHTLSLGR